jgi:hypothetical protein
MYDICLNCRNFYEIFYLLIFLNLWRFILPLLRELARGCPKIARKNKTETGSLEVSSCNLVPYPTGFFYVG